MSLFSTILAKLGFAKEAIAQTLTQPAAEAAATAAPTGAPAAVPQVDVVAKLEHHWATGYAAEEPEAPILGDPVKSPYTILSLSVSF